MKKIPFILCLAFCVFALFYACKKDPEPPPPTKTELLTGTTWKLQDRYEKRSSDTAFRKVNMLMCNRESTMHFYKNGTFEEKRSTPSCTPVLPLPFADNTGSWRFEQDETVLQLHSGIGLFSYKILKLDTYQLTIEEETSSGTLYRDEFRRAN